AVDVLMGAQGPGERFLVLAACDRNRMTAHLGRELHTEVTQPADSEYRDAIPGPGAAVTQRIERGDSGAQQRRSLRGGQFVRDGGQRFERYEQVICISAVVRDARNLTG